MGQSEFRKIVQKEKDKFSLSNNWGDKNWFPRVVCSPSRPFKRVSISFQSGHLPPGENIPFCAPYADFARAVFANIERSYFDSVSIGPFEDLIAALRLLYAASVDIEHDPVRIRRLHLLAAEQMAAGRYSIGKANAVTEKLALIANFLEENNITTHRLGYRHGLRRSVEATPKSEMVSVSDVIAVADISNRADLSYNDNIMRCALDLMFCGGLRVSEVITLPTDTWYEHECFDIDGKPVFDASGKPLIYYGLRYWGVKANIPVLMIKPIPSVLVPIAKRALARILVLTKGPREVAVYQESHSGDTLLGERWDLLDQTHRMRSLEVALALKTTDLSNVKAVDLMSTAEKRSLRGIGRTFLRRKGLGELSVKSGEKNGFSQGAREVDLSQLKSLLYAESDHGNCVPRAGSVVPLHRLLFIMRSGVLGDHQGYNGTVRMILYSSIRTFLGGSSKEQKSIFERFGYKDGDQAVALTSRQFRLTLTMVAIAGGMTDVEIAKFSGRKTLAANRYYDPRSGESKADLIREIVTKDASFVTMKSSGVIDLEGKGVIVEGMASLSTTQGMCYHDYGSDVCQQWSLGMQNGTVPSAGTASEREALVVRTRRQLAATIDEEAQGTFGASSWVAALRSGLQKVSDYQSDVNKEKS